MQITLQISVKLSNKLYRILTLLRHWYIIIKTYCGTHPMMHPYVTYHKGGLNMSYTSTTVGTVNDEFAKLTALCIVAFFICICFVVIIFIISKEGTEKLKSLLRHFSGNHKSPKLDDEYDKNKNDTEASNEEIIKKLEGG